MSGTVQYCLPYGKDFFKTDLRLLENNSVILNAVNYHRNMILYNLQY
jgi:hypothetical protein